MEIGSKLGVYKIKLVEPKNGEPFYLATVFEKVYNNSHPAKWETIFYNDVYIFDTSIVIEPADLTLNVKEKDKFAFDNIANKDTAIIRVLDYKFEKHTVWRNQEQVKDDYGKPILKDIHYLRKISMGDKQWRSDDGLYKLLQRKYEAQKVKIAEQKRKNLDKDVEYRKIIREIKAEKDQLSREVKRLEEIIEKQKQSVAEAKISVKEANKQVMVVRRKNTLAEKQLDEAHTKLEEKKQEIKEVKKMKKQEMLEKAEEFSFNYDDFDM